MMINKQEEFLQYVENNTTIKVLDSKLDSIEKEIDSLEYSLTKVMEGGPLERAILNELHNLRLKKLSIQVQMNTLERKILQFELTEELSE